MCGIDVLRFARGYTQRREMYSNTNGRSWKFKRRHAYKDYDKDGKVNKYDCKPLNPYKQDKIRLDTENTDVLKGNMGAIYYPKESITKEGKKELGIDERTKGAIVMDKETLRSNMGKRFLRHEMQHATSKYIKDGRDNITEEDLKRELEREKRLIIGNTENIARRYKDDRELRETERALSAREQLEIQRRHAKEGKEERIAQEIEAETVSTIPHILFKSKHPDDIELAKKVKGYKILGKNIYTKDDEEIKKREPNYEPLKFMEGRKTRKEEQMTDIQKLREIINGEKEIGKDGRPVMEIKGRGRPRLTKEELLRKGFTWQQIEEREAKRLEREKRLAEGIGKGMKRMKPSPEEAYDKEMEGTIEQMKIAEKYNDKILIRILKKRMEKLKKVKPHEFKSG